MSTVVPIMAAIAGLACPAHMWWRMRRGEGAVCCLAPSNDPEALAERQRLLQARVAALTAADDHAGRG